MARMMRFGWSVVLAILVGSWNLALADEAPAEPAAQPAEQPGEEPALTPQQQEAKKLWDAALAAATHGPAKVTLRDQAALDLPANFVFVPKAEAAALMHAMGNQTGDDFIGLVFPEADDKNWMVSVDYEGAGYIKDDDAKNWDADELLKNLRDGTDAANEERVKMGVPALEVTRWIEKPAYEPAVHQLVWSAEAKLKDRPDDNPTVNYNTYVLGREGYISMNLITSLATVEEDKPVARKLLAGVAFNDGKRYTDFNASTDKVAAYGLAALVAGVAAKKLGLLALIGAFILKFAKVFAVGAAAAGGGVWKWIKNRGRKDPGTPA